MQLLLELRVLACRVGEGLLQADILLLCRLLQAHLSLVQKIQLARQLLHLLMLADHVLLQVVGLRLQLGHLLREDLVLLLQLRRLQQQVLLLLALHVDLAAELKELALHLILVESVLVDVCDEALVFVGLRLHLVLRLLDLASQHVVLLLELARQ